VWDLAQRLTGQLRVVPGAVLGLDMTAALAMAQALGVDTLVAAELLPEIEAMMVRGLNARIGAERDG
jgi:hypothetical protein